MLSVVADFAKRRSPEPELRSSRRQKVISSLAAKVWSIPLGWNQ
jgi:hypothetical protein